MLLVIEIIINNNDFTNENELFTINDNLSWHPIAGTLKTRKKNV